MTKRNEKRKNYEKTKKKEQKEKYGNIKSGFKSNHIIWYFEKTRYDPRITTLPSSVHITRSTILRVSGAWKSRGGRRHGKRRGTTFGSSTGHLSKGALKIARQPANTPSCRLLCAGWARIRRLGGENEEEGGKGGRGEGPMCVL